MSKIEKLKKEIKTHLEKAVELTAQLEAEPTNIEDVSIQQLRYRTDNKSLYINASYKMQDKPAKAIAGTVDLSEKKEEKAKSKKS